MADYVTTIQIPPTLLAMIRQESKDTGNSIVSIIRQRVMDSYRREAAELGLSLAAEGTEQYNGNGQEMPLAQ